MPPEKKPEKKEEAPPKKDAFEEIVIYFFGFMFVIYALNGLLGGITEGGGVNNFFSRFTPQGILLAKTHPISSLSNPIGARFIVTSKESVVYNSPRGKKIDTKKLGDRGTIIGGSVTEDGVKYRQVRFDDPSAGEAGGTVGWVAEKDIGALNQKTRPLSSVSPNEDVLGKTVSASQDDTTVFDEPGGNQIATKNIGAKGKIIDGPVTVGGVRYWHVRFTDGTEGWVEENALDLVEDVETSFFSRLIGFVFSSFQYFKFLMWVVSAGLVYLIIYLFKKLSALRIAEAKLMYIDVPTSTKEVNPKWERVITHIESANENDWRLAILEADIILDDLLDRLSLPGETMGERLKAVEKSDFTTVDYAWEAHKVRNQIAHEGADFGLTQREARRIVQLYRAVFEEFKII